uniref:Uncharacterized protein n=1 Tax=Tetranychus urticae TaxID=32264 RepID=T1KX27_TETUR
MNEVGRNSDKIRHSDEDYHEITIDWSNESFDFMKQLFHQLSAYTGIPVEHQECVSVHNVNPPLNIGLVNAEVNNGRGLEFYAWETDTKERAMRCFHDGDCFLLQTTMISYGLHPGICCTYELVHRDLVSEVGCNLHYCHYLGIRAITKRISELVSSDYIQKILSVERETDEDRKRVLLNLNIYHLEEVNCSAVVSVYPYLGFQNNYLRYRG